MIEWKPISEIALRARVSQGETRMSPGLRRLWSVVQIEPEKWQQHPHGDQGSGFWVVAVIGRTVIWYNDLEEGFNRSNYSAYGTIDEYWCNQDELELTVQYLMNTLDQGFDLLSLSKKSKKLAR